MKKVMTYSFMLACAVLFCVFGTYAANAAAVSETEIETIDAFLNDRENELFSTDTYEDGTKVPVYQYGLEGCIEARSVTEEERNDPEISRLVETYKAQVFTKEAADAFFQKKLGLNFDELDIYEEYKATHTVPGDEDTFYIITEGGGLVGIFGGRLSIESVKATADGNREVTVVYREDVIGREDQRYRLHRHIVTLKPAGDSYIFLSCLEDPLTENWELDNDKLPNGDLSEYLGIWQSFQARTGETPAYELNLISVENNVARFAYASAEDPQPVELTATLAADSNHDAIMEGNIGENDAQVKGRMMIYDHIIFLTCSSDSNGVSAIFYRRADQPALTETRTEDGETEKLTEAVEESVLSATEAVPESGNETTAVAGTNTAWIIAVVVLSVLFVVCVCVICVLVSKRKKS